MSIPNTPWFSSKNPKEEFNFLNEDTLKTMLYKNYIVGFRHCTGETMYSLLIRRFIEILFTHKKFELFRSFCWILEKNKSLNILKSLNKVIEEFDTPNFQVLTPNTNPEEIVDLIYSNKYSDYFKYLAKEFILSKLSEYQGNNYNEIYNWLLDETCDIEGELFGILGSALNCKIIEYTMIFDIKETVHSDPIDSEISINLYRYSNMYFLLMKIQEMEELVLNIRENKIYAEESM